MLPILAIIAPVFGIIALGYLCGRTGYLGDEAGRGIADFAFNVTIPALLFRTIVLAHFDGVGGLGILASFFGAAAAVWLLTAVLTRTVLRRPDADAPAIAMCAVFGNTIMLGLPIGVATFGSEALAPISVILGVHAPLFLLAATLHTALVSERTGAETLTSALGGVARQLARQPIIVAIAIATVWRMTGAGVPAPMLTMVDTLAAAGVPAALISLGLSLGSFTIGGDRATLGAMLGLKLVIQPLIAAVLAVFVFRLPTISAEIVVLMAALPAGANAYLFAVKSGRAINSASAAVALGTAFSAVTLAALIALVRSVT
jgi:malonate transporter and related proteins